MKAKILLFGGSGKLGTELRKLDSAIVAPSKKEVDIRYFPQVALAVAKSNCDAVIHAAALVGTKECEENRRLAWATNVEGTKNIAKICHVTGKRLVFVSSAAIFDGEKGNYSEDDIPSPTFFYAVTKVIGEQIVRCFTPGGAVIRLDFFPLDRFKYKKVFADHYTSKISVSQAAFWVLKIANSSFSGTIHVGRKRESLFNILKPYYPSIQPTKIRDSTLPDFPKDISLNLNKWRKLYGRSESV